MVKFSIPGVESINLLGEVKNGELAVVFFCGFIIRLCGFDFAVEGSDEFALAVIAYLDIPFLCSFLEAHSFIF